MNYAQVAILKSGVNWSEVLTYKVPKGVILNIGSLVNVPFGPRYLKGLVLNLTNENRSGLDNEKIKKMGLIAVDSLLSPIQIELAKFMSAYYLAPLSKCLGVFLSPLGDIKNLSVPYKESYSWIRDKKLRGKNQLALLEFLKGQKREVNSNVVKRQSFYSAQSLKGLLEKDLVRKKSEPLYVPLTNYKYQASSLQLTPLQTEALNACWNSEKPTLLHGVTGSGKTEIYLRLIQKMMSEEKQSLLLVPEISLTPQLTEYFRKSLGDSVAIFHSGLKGASRKKEWWRVKMSKLPLVIGSRSALFAPFYDLGLIIIDEEHEWTYKQESAPHYHTRHLAEKMHELNGCKLVLGSATPQAESFYKAKIGSYQYFSLPKRIHKEGMPSIKIVDLRDEFKKKNLSIFSDLLRTKIEDCLKKNEQVILFINRRGMANAVVCRDCGYKETCVNCDTTLKLHRSHKTDGSKEEYLVCHYCSYSKLPPIQCPECQSVYIKNIGLGTQRVQSELSKCFPGVKSIRADRDTVGKNGFKEIYQKFLNHEYQVLIGTQMITKGLDFSKVSLIGVMLADVGLHIPDFRSSERVFQLLTQVSGRCGRSSGGGEVILQTYQPENPVLQGVSNYNYIDFIENELALRREFHYPPFKKLIKFIVVDSDQKKLEDRVLYEVDSLNKLAKENVLDLEIYSAPAVIPKVSNLYYYQVLLKGSEPKAIFNFWKIPVGWRIDVDPINSL